MLLASTFAVAEVAGGVMADAGADRSKAQVGTYSVRAHTDLRQLIVDAYVRRPRLPCPEDDEDFDRWVRQGWDPELLPCA